MPIQNKLAALHDAVEQVTSLIDENDALLVETDNLRASLTNACARRDAAEAAYDRLSQRMHRWFLVPGVADALKKAGVSDDL